MGFMGCGKSSVGRELARLLCCPFMDLDEVIEEAEGRSIPEIFATDGEAAFRRMEAETLQNLISQLPKCSRGPLPLRGPLPQNLLPQASRCKGPQDRLLIAPEGGKMPLPHNRQSGLLPDTNTSIHHGKQLNAVVALGGGTVMTRECAEMVREKTVCIYLRASVETLAGRLADQADGRPLLAGTSLRGAQRRSNLQGRIEELLALRSGTYEQTAHMVIDTDGKSIADIAMEIHRNLDKIS